MFFFMENPIKMDDLGENPLFSETSIMWIMFLNLFNFRMLNHLIPRKLQHTPGNAPSQLWKESHCSLLVKL